jgi:hypothetical protein
MAGKEPEHFSMSDKRPEGIELASIIMVDEETIVVSWTEKFRREFTCSSDNVKWMVGVLRGQADDLERAANGGGVILTDS